MRYKDDHLQEIRFPLGGIGTGSICIAGNGALLDWEIFNRPNKGSFNEYSFFAVKAKMPDGRQCVKVLQGDWNKDLTGQFIGHYGFGPNCARMFGFPHFRHVEFDGAFPIATLRFEDDEFPGAVVLRAFNPFIPLDSENSSLPAAFFDLTFESPSDGIEYTALLNVRNPMGSTVNRKLPDENMTAVQMKNGELSPEDVKYGDLTVAVDRADGFYQEYGFRGKWRDNITLLWHDLEIGIPGNRVYDTPGKDDTCLVGASVVSGRGVCAPLRFVLSWNVPNFEVYWDEERNGETWKNYYATRFADSAESCRYAMKHWQEMYEKTCAFTDVLHRSSLDPAVIDAASANLSVLKTATVLRLQDGTFWGWEGLGATWGSCQGTCVHVWNYVYSLCFLFPDLEQSLRTSELRYSMDEAGHLQYRSRLPLEKGPYDWRPCLDGQMGTVIKIYRDWKISGDTQWLKDHWEKVKKLLEYAWSEENPDEWDRNKDGVLEGRQHHTLDIPLFGASSWLEGMYLAALKAAAEMAGFLGEPEKQEAYLQLFQKGYAWSKENLFNGSYFYHRIDVSDRTPIDHFGDSELWNEERQQIKYQISEGCQIDQMLGQWHANLCGLGDIFDKQQRQTALRSMMKYNFKPVMRDVVNSWRIFAINDESGSVICDYPEGSDKPVIPISYCPECMTGFEYSFAGLLISEGLIEEGLRVVRAVRDRFDGAKRNPWNEFECGNNYARSMASFALLPIFSGFSFDLPHRSIGFAPLLAGEFRCFWGLGTGWGEYVRQNGTHSIGVKDGAIELERVTLGGIGTISRVYADGKPVAFAQDGEELRFAPVRVSQEIRFEEM